MSIDKIIDLNPGALKGSQPDPASYGQASADWCETEYRVNFHNQSVEGGYWTGSAGNISFESWPYRELCVILRGRVAIEDSTGQIREFGAGESFVIPQGFRGTWHTLEDTEKVFMGVRENL